MKYRTWVATNTGHLRLNGKRAKQDVAVDNNKINSVDVKHHTWGSTNPRRLTRAQKKKNKLN